MMIYSGPNQGVIGARKGSLTSQGGPLDGKRAFGMLIVLNLARSQGRLTLASADPEDRPELDYNYFGDPTDLPRLRDGVRKGLQIFHSAEMQEVCEAEERHGVAPDSPDAQIDEYIKGGVSTSFHICGATKMGAADD